MVGSCVRRRGFTAEIAENAEQRIRSLVLLCSAFSAISAVNTLGSSFLAADGHEERAAEALAAGVREPRLQLRPPLGRRDLENSPRLGRDRARLGLHAGDA